MHRESNKCRAALTVSGGQSRAARSVQLGGVPRVAAGHRGDARALARPPRRRLLRPLAESLPHSRAVSLGAGTGGRDSAHFQSLL